jgi:transmembrane sensor
MDESLHNDKMNTEFNSLETEEKVLRYSAQYKVPHAISKEEALQLVKSRIADGYRSKNDEKDRHLGYYWMVSAAASLIFLLGIWYLLTSKPLTEVAIAKGQHFEYQLPDGSDVTLNADSKISFKKEKFNNNRYLKLDGEAFFSVKKGSAFTVNTDFADIKVLGTSFNIYARDNVFKVSCLTGKVSVTSKDQSYIITLGESVELSNNQLNKFKDMNVGTITNWRIGEFNYYDVPLKRVLQEIERQFNVNFVGANIDNKYFTGGFTNKNLVDALDVVCIPMGLTYEIGSNSNILISEKTR